jgi:hypothetical protein
MDDRQAAQMPDRLLAIPKMRAIFNIDMASLPLTPRQFAEGWTASERGQEPETLRAYASAFVTLASSLGYVPCDLPVFCLNYELPADPPRDESGTVIGSLGWVLPRLSAIGWSIQDGVPVWCDLADKIEEGDRQTAGGLITRCARMLERRAAFLDGFKGPSVRDRDEPMDAADLFDMRDVFPNSTPEKDGLTDHECLLVYRAARVQFRAKVQAGDYPPNVAAAAIVERTEQKFCAADAGPTGCSLISRWRMQPIRLAVDHELKGHPFDPDGNRFDHDDYDGRGELIRDEDRSDR